MFLPNQDPIDSMFNAYASNMFNRDRQTDALKLEVIKEGMSAQAADAGVDRAQRATDVIVSIGNKVLEEREKAAPTDPKVVEFQTKYLTAMEEMLELVKLKAKA